MNIGATWATSRSQKIGDFCACVERAVHHRRAIKDTWEQWLAAGGASPSSEDSASWCGVRTSTVVEKKQVEYVHVSALFVSEPAPSNIRASP